ncbi:hypothetical protein TNCV_1011391 [Trichonephila clavipes]|uniref:Uncharacterized protein n=1 Tax=Trichonephila clavipes TaxID=2585209 RepID=A0A8X6VXB7_TRICX|nr:hypothetical protein TNCV_1011391 [Trichonephila clavipes]
MLWGGKLLVETILRQTRTPSFVHSLRNEINCLNSCWIMLCKFAEIVEVEIEVGSPSIVPSGNFAELNRTVTCMVLKANDRRTSCPCHDEFRGLRSDYVRQVASENNNVLFLRPKT